MNMLHIILSGLLIFSQGCSSQRMGKKMDFEVNDATSQRWTGGVQGSGWGINYIFQLKKNTDEQVNFDTLWIGARPFIPEKIYNKQQVEKVPAEGEFRLMMQYHVQDNPYTNERTVNPEESADAPEYDGDALIVYRKNGERKTYVVKQIRELPPEYYP